MKGDFKLLRMLCFAVVIPAIIYRLLTGRFSVNTSGQEMLVVILALAGGFLAIAMNER